MRKCANAVMAVSLNSLESVSRLRSHLREYGYGGQDGYAAPGRDHCCPDVPARITPKDWSLASLRQTGEAG